MDESSVAIIAAGLSLLGAFATAGIAAVIQIRIARSTEVSEKRRLCFSLQQQFDSPAMFHHRFVAWKRIEDAHLPESVTVHTLFDEYWDESTSAVIHFFESLEHYCAGGLLDVDLAVKLFARPFTLWNDLLLGKLHVDEASAYYLPWLGRVRAFGLRLPQPEATIVPLPESAPAG